MGPKKKKSAGDAAKGEKVFKNLCGVCHSLSVSNKVCFSYFRPTLLDQLLEVSEDPILPLVTDSITRLLCQQRLPWNGLLVTWIDGWSPQLPSLLVMPWLLPEFHPQRTEVTSLLSLWAEQWWTRLLFAAEFTLCRTHNHLSKFWSPLIRFVNNGIY